MKRPAAVHTRVVFRKYPKRRDGSGGDVLAILLDCDSNLGTVTCYQHVGQHGEGRYFEMMATTKPATPEEYADLKRELEEIGYAVYPRKRRAIQGSNRDQTYARRRLLR